jgi:hypothetical protein
MRAREKTKEMMPNAPKFIKVKEGFYFVESPEIRESAWYLRRNYGQGTHAEVAKDVETGVFIAPWPFNKHIAVESHTDPEQRNIWDQSSVPEVIILAYDEIIRQLAEEEKK